jgi:hypothetical protein
MINSGKRLPAVFAQQARSCGYWGGHAGTNPDFRMINLGKRFPGGGGCNGGGAGIVIQSAL